MLTKEEFGKKHQRNAELQFLEAVEHSNLKAVKICIESANVILSGTAGSMQFNINYLLKGHTPLMMAARKGKTEIARYLTGRGAELDVANNDGVTATFLAAQEGQLNVLQFLVGKGADKDKADAGGRSPFYIAARKGHVAVIQCLLDHGAEDKTNNNGTSALWIAAQKGHLPLV